MTEAIQWCNEILAAAPDDRGIEMPIAHALAHMHARLGNFELARSQAARCLEIANESGQRSAAMTLTEAAADLETLAGDHATAERMLAVGCDWFSSLGAPHAVLEAFHGLSQGYGHIPVDVQRLAAIADAQGPLSLGRLRGPPPQGGRALLEAAMAGAHLNEGRYVEAE
ncbi:MAG: tetratricopeptide repeat protein, partial [Chloroflexota bacterium]|nr:tetratricopeptide repeat protein [Chloroflexota bacterium]